jgi:hypothetical protein
MHSLGIMDVLLEELNKDYHEMVEKEKAVIAEGMS